MGNILTLRQLYAQGHTIIILTGRRMRTHSGNVAAVIADIGATTINSLKRYGIPYHELAFGKPYAQFYIDDLAVNACDDIYKETGFYPNSNKVARPAKPAGGAAAAAPAGRDAGAGASWARTALVALAGIAAGFALGRMRR